MSAVVRLVEDPKVWAEAEFEAIANALTSADRQVNAAKDHMRLLVENWEDGRNVARLYPEYQSAGAVFEAKFPGLYEHSTVKRIAQAHKLRLLVGGAQSAPPSEQDVSDDSLRQLGDPDYWSKHLGELAAVWEKAKAIAAERMAGMKRNGITPSRGVIAGDIRQAMGRARSVGTGSVEYWHNVLHNLTTYASGLDATMAIRVATTAVWAANRAKGSKPADPKEIKELLAEVKKLPGA